MGKVRGFNIAGGGSIVKNVYRGVIGLTGTSTSVTLPAVNTSKTIVKIGRGRHGAAATPEVASTSAEGWMESPTSLRIERGDPDDTLILSYEVVEFEDVVTVAEYRYTNVSDQNTETITPVDLNKSEIFYSAQTPDARGNIALCTRLAWLEANNSIEFRASTDGSNVVWAFTCYVVTYP